MGGDDSQKLLPWRGIYSPPGRKPPAQYEINTVTETAPRFARLPAGVWLSYSLPGSFLASTGGSLLARAEVIEHGRRRILHFNVTQHPTAEWVAQQLREAFP